MRLVKLVLEIFPMGKVRFTLFHSKGVENGMIIRFLVVRDKPEPFFRRLMQLRFTRLLSKTTSLAEINNVSQKGC